MTNKEPYSCEDCLYKESCINEFNKEYKSIIGSHFCRRSWEKFEDEIKSP